MKLRYGIILILLLVPGISFSQTRKMRVAVTHTGFDSIGQTFAFAVKEAIRGSQAFVLFEHDFKNPVILVRMVSVDNKQGTGDSSSLAVAIVYESANTPGLGILLDLTVHNCARDRVPECARGVVPDIDQAVEQLRRDNLGLWEKLSFW
jgi:hypothetical protein